MRRILFLALAVAWLPAIAQFNGYSSPQAVVTKPFNAVSTAQASSTIRNLGQTTHLVIYTTTGAGPVRIRMEFSYDNATWAPMSPDDTDVPGASTPSAIFATGTFPYFRLNLLTLGGGSTLTAFYSGTSATTLASTSLFNASQQYKQLIGFQVAENVTTSATIPVPFGAAGGTIWFLFNSAPGSSADVLSATCGPDINTADQLQVFSQTLNQTTALRTFLIGSVPCSDVSVTFTPGGGASGAVTWSAWYQFTMPNVPSKVIAGSGGTATQQAEPDFDCSQSAAVTISTGAAGSTRVVTGSGNEIIHVCAVVAPCTVAQTITLQQGTGTNCATGTAGLSGDMPGQTNFSLLLTPANSLRLSSGNDFCIKVGAAASCGGLVTYAKF